MGKSPGFQSKMSQSGIQDGEARKKEAVIDREAPAIRLSCLELGWRLCFGDPIPLAGPPGQS